MKKTLTLIIAFLIPVLIFADSTNSIQYIKEKRIKWRNERFFDELIEKAGLVSNDDFIYLKNLQEKNTQAALL